MPPVTDADIYALLSTVMPEYVSKKWAPIDQGTINNHMNIMSDHFNMAADPLFSIFSDTLDPATLQPTVTETPIDDPNAPVRPERPQSPLLAMYGGRDDFVTKAWLDALERGMNPSAAVEEAYTAYNQLVAEGQMEGDEIPLRDEEGGYTPEVAAVLEDAVKVRDELAGERLYEQDLSSYEEQMANYTPPVETEVEQSEMAQQLMAMGIDPTKTEYTPEMLAGPEYDAIKELAEQSAGQSERATKDYNKAEAKRKGQRQNMKNAQQGQGQVDANALVAAGDFVAPLGGIPGQGANALAKAGEQFRSYPGHKAQQDWLSSATRGYKDARKGAARARGQMSYANAQSAEAGFHQRVAQRVAEGQARQLQQQGRSPIKDALMQRLGLSLGGQAGL